MSLLTSKAIRPDDPLAPPSAMFSLGRRFNSPPEADQAWDAWAVRSFGLRHLCPVPPRNTAPVLTAGYCPHRQMAVLGGELVIDSPVLATQVTSTYTTTEDNQSWPDHEPDSD